MIKLLYLARLREALGLREEEWPLPEGEFTVDRLVAELRRRGGAWASELAPGRSVRIAVNQTLAQGATRIAAGDEVALFPPVTGG